MRVTGAVGGACMVHLTSAVTRPPPPNHHIQPGSALQFQNQAMLAQFESPQMVRGHMWVLSLGMGS